jgi:predicted DNA-binding antitoxin AbrB/MazE fold protein
VLCLLYETLYLKFPLIINKPKDGDKMANEMREQMCDAIFKDGVFQILNPKAISIAEGQKVRLIVEPINTSKDILDLATSVYKDLSEEQIDEVEKLVLSREDFFKGRQSV